MKKSLFAAIIISVFIISCGDTRNKNDVQEIFGEEPADVKILPEELMNSGGYDRKYQDIIENLFSEELKNDESLQSLYIDINAINELTADSTESTRKFLDLNHRYFRTAEDHVLSLHDSLLRNKVMSIFQKEKSKYNALVDPHAFYLEEIKNRKLILEDRKNLLRLFITLPLMKKYQDEKLPNVEQLINIKKDIEFLIKESEKIVNIE
jgi:hypothetical protein